MSKQKPWGQSPRTARRLLWPRRGSIGRDSYSNHGPQGALQGQQRPPGLAVGTHGLARGHHAPCRPAKPRRTPIKPGQPNVLENLHNFYFQQKASRRHGESQNLAQRLNSHFVNYFFFLLSGTEVRGGPSTGSPSGLLKLLLLWPWPHGTAVVSPSAPEGTAGDRNTDTQSCRPAFPPVQAQLQCVLSLARGPGSRSPSPGSVCARRLHLRANLK